MVNAHIHFIMSKIGEAGKALERSLTHFLCYYSSQDINLQLSGKAGSCARWNFDVPSAAVCVSMASTRLLWTDGPEIKEQLNLGGT